MEKRLLLFLVLSLGVLVGYSTLMRVINPPRPAVVDQGEGDQGEAAEHEAAAGDVPDAESVPPEERSEAPGSTPPDEPRDAEPSPTVPVQQWASIGSYAPGSGWSLLVTFNSQGATIERVEITARDKNGKLRYNQLGRQLGYLGHLALTPQEGRGCIVNVVGHGTPADLAGVQVGDVLLDVGGSPIDEPTVLAQILDETKPGEALALTIRRSDGEAAKNLTLNATLDVRPLALIHPEPLRGTQVTPHPLSFDMGVQQQRGQQSISIDSPRVGIWQMDVQTGESPTVEFRYELSEAVLDRNGGTGSLELVKRFTLPKPDEAATTPQYHLLLDVELHNPSDSAMDLSYRLRGPNGLPTEGWWYSAKIHKRMFYGAGARDVQCKTKGEGWWIVGCPELFKQAKKEKKDKFVTLFDAGIPDEDYHILDFLAVDTQYFAAVLSPITDDDAPVKFEEATAFALGDVTKLGRGESRTTNVSFELASEVRPVAARASMAQSFQLFLGPKDPEVLAAYELQDVIYYGWFGGISRVLKEILHFFYRLVGNYGLAILMLTIVVRGCMFPLSRKAAKNAAMMQELAPEMRKLTEKYKNDMEKRAKAQQELFRKHNYNPLGGCWLMFLQLPIFLGLYRCIAVDIELRQAALIPGIAWCSNLAGPDQLVYWKNFMFFSSETSMLGPYLNVLPLITVALFIMHQKLFTPPATDEQSRMQLTMMKYMTLFMGFLFFKVASGLCLYFIASSMWGLAERLLVPKPKVNLSGAAPSAAPPAKKASKSSKPDAVAEKKAARKKRNKRR